MDQTSPRDPRPAVNLRIKFRSQSLDQFIERYAIDVSRGGIFIRTRDPLAVGTQLRLDFQYQDGAQLMAGEGTVVWIREFDPNRTGVAPGMGVRFDKLTPEGQSTLDQILSEKAKRERGGIPGSIMKSAGGIAVRRPSSMFTVLEPHLAGAVMPPGGGSLTGSFAVPNWDGGKALDAAVAGAQATGGRPIDARAGEGPQAHGAQSGAETPPYRPIGTTRNPFAGTGTPKPAVSSEPPRTAADAGAGDQGDTRAASGAGGQAGDASSAAVAGAHGDAGMSSGSFDANEDPTQIADIPSIMSHAAGALFGTKDGAKDGAPARTTANPDENGGARVAEAAAPSAEASADAVTRKHSLDAFPPFAQMRAPEGGSGADPARAGSTPEPVRGAAAKSAAGAQSTSSGTSTEEAASRSANGETKESAKASTTTLTKEARKDTSKPVAGAASKKERDFPEDAETLRDGRETAPQRSSAALIAVIVLGLGGAGVFAWRYFASGLPDPIGAGSAGTNAATLEPAGEPSPAAPVAPAPEQAPAGEEPGAAGPAGASAAPAAAAAPAAPATGTEGAAASARPESETGAASGRGAKAAGSRHADKVGQGESPRLVKAKQPVSDGTARAAVSSGEASAGGAATAEPTAEAAAPVRQIRITSSPSGADVLMDGAYAGRTPYTQSDVDFTTARSITLLKDGYEPHQQMVANDSAGWTAGKRVKGRPTVVLVVSAKLRKTGGSARTGAAAAATAPAAATTTPPTTTPPAAGTTAPTAPPAAGTPAPDTDSQAAADAPRPSAAEKREDRPDDKKDERKTQDKKTEDDRPLAPGESTTAPAPMAPSVPAAPSAPPVSPPPVSGERAPVLPN